MQTLTHRLKRLQSILVCPTCGESLDFEYSTASCAKCGANYPISDGKIYFVSSPDRTDDLDSLKGFLKRYIGKYYYTIGVKVLAPTYPFDYLGWIRRYLDPEEQIIVDVGCGNHRINEHIICLDFFDYDVVDVVCDLKALPFKPNSIDAFASRSVLEHVQDPIAVIQDLYRCTRPGGLGLHLAPFLFPFHASPDDFQRFTHKGMEVLFKDWEIVAQTNATGPITLVLLCAIEFLSILLSFGREKVKAFIYLFLCGVLFPLKYLDAMFVDRKSFFALAPTIFNVVRKHEKP